MDNKERELEIRHRLDKLSEKLVQVMAGAYLENLEDIKTEFQTLHNEIRQLEGKPPREYNIQQN